ncbi:ATPase [Ligilactobacillus agilis]|uniref:P-type Ca(2+) transporter n=1 Tax=Ligilactobacillus agilis TaxID=1601 RepID=A0A231QEY1_9LACO|nr:cation-translocating P-type ATPase [Ligilactobacillus agilis]OXC08624.1 ATPase [Ligilactobacillus agilis]OXC10711.1 ATPase [Ligilactobacillus agilis]OXC12050.1 ATPase [Ligilactobacillus agilis]OXS37820.1 ATPase [Ligilactobacillus agilis]OXS41333.1 ATPase [Ligilactobacillus agilis]
MALKYHQLDATQVLAQLHTKKTGLSQTEAATRLQATGPNKLSDHKQTSLLTKFILQFKDLMIIILMIAAFVALLAGEGSDAIIIFLVIILNAVFGVFQEAKAENAIAALQKMTTPKSRVLRDQTVQVIDSEDLVPGDVVLLEAGDIIPADVYFLEANALKVEEAALTGESVPVEKQANPLPAKDIPLAEQTNLGFMNTNVTYGTAQAVVVETGMATQVGQIAKMLTEVDQTVTPLQKNISHLSKVLSVLILVIAAFIFAFGTLTGRESPLDMLLTAISLAVAAIPEGLPAIVTITLALGTQKMAKKHALIRKLPAVETLGATQIIASDKTGTLTQNKMTVEQFYTDGQLKPAAQLKFQADSKLALAMLLANDSQQTPTGLVGDPTETALIQHFLGQTGFDWDKVCTAYPRTASLPFDSDRKLMSVQTGDLLLTKGAPDELLRRANFIEEAGQVTPLTKAKRQELAKVNKQLADQALRVLGFAYKKLAPADQLNLEAEQDLIFVGLIGMIDPERPEVKAAVAEAKQAGIRPSMITGDHMDTARAIAIRLGIIAPTDTKGVISGAQLDQLSDQELAQHVGEYSVYARVAPEHKVRIVKAWQAHGKIVAMTGDGVNDAPALKTADIGVGMGITGTEVSKNAADIVLADDNFATIILAVKEGRKVFANIQKAIQYLLSANLGEVLTLFLMTIFNWSIFAPVQILWINLVTDTFPAIALGVEPGDKGLMEQAPRGLKSNFLSNGVGFNIIYQGLLEGLLTLGVYLYAICWPVHQDPTLIHQDALTMAYITLGFLQLVHAFNCKSLTASVFSKQIFANKFFNWAILTSALLLAATIFIPQFNVLFHVSPLNLSQWGVVLLAGALLVIIVELVKAYQRTKK